MTSPRIDFGLILKLTIWSFLVGALLYWLNWSPGEVYAWIINKIAALWDWLVGIGLNYVLLGATIVVPLYLLFHFKNKLKR